MPSRPSRPSLELPPITPRTVTLAVLATLAATLIVVLLVVLVRGPAPDTHHNPPDDQDQDTISTTPPPDLTVRALVTPADPPRAAADAGSNSTETETVLTANLFLASPGEPLPTPLTDDSGSATTTPTLQPTGQAAIRCTDVARNAITALCDGQALTAYGQLTFAGAQIESDALADPPEADLTFAITGGTGDYRAVRGTLSITAHTPTQQDWVFHFARPSEDEDTD